MFLFLGRASIEASVRAIEPKLATMSAVLKQCVKKIVDMGEGLTGEEALEAIRSIMKGEATPGQCGAFLVALKSVKLEPEARVTTKAGVVESIRLSVGLVSLCPTAVAGVGRCLGHALRLWLRRLYLATSHAKGHRPSAHANR